MSESYTKLASKIVYSSLWEEDGDTCKIWVTLLGLKDDGGVVDQNVTGIARVAKLSIETVEAALLKFQSPDPRSSSEEFEGRRIMKVERGWFVLNHEKFKEYGWSAEKKEYERQRKAQWRQKQNPPGAVPDAPAVPHPDSNGVVTAPSNPAGSTNHPSSIEECICAGGMLNIPELVCRKFWLHYESTSKQDENGKTVWVTGADGGKVVGKWSYLLKIWSEKERSGERRAPTGRRTLKDQNLDEPMPTPRIITPGAQPIP